MKPGHQRDAYIRITGDDERTEIKLFQIYEGMVSSELELVQTWDLFASGEKNPRDWLKDNVVQIVENL